MSVDHTKAYELLGRINSIEVDGKPISFYFTYCGYDLWGVYQSSLFYDLKKNVDNLSSTGIEVKRSFRVSASLFLKKIIAHFLLFVVTLISFILTIFSPREVLLFVGDKISSPTLNNDVRIDPIYEFLRDSRISFVELIHTIPGARTFRNLYTRKRLVLFYESFGFFVRKKRRIFLHDTVLKDFSKEEADFVRYLVGKYEERFYVSKAWIHTFSWVLKKMRPKAVWGIDDTRYCGELAIVCAEVGIPLYLFQHGHFTKYHVGWLKYQKQTGVIPRATYLVVWSSYWKQELSRLNTYYEDREIIVGGEKVSMMGNNVDRIFDSNVSFRKSVLIPYETDAPKDDLKVFLEKFKEAGFKVYFKIRSDIPKKVQCDQYGISENDMCVVDEYLPILKDVCLVVGVYSTFLYDLLKSNIPVAILETPMDYGYGMVENGLAGIIYKNHPICEQVERLYKEYPLRRENITKVFSEKKLLIETIADISKQCNIILKK